MSPVELIFTILLIALILMLLLLGLVYNLVRNNTGKSLDDLQTWYDETYTTLPEQYNKRIEALLQRIETLEKVNTTQKDPAKANEIIALKEIIIQLQHSAKKRSDFEAQSSIDNLIKEGKANKNLKRHKVVYDIVNDRDVFLYGALQGDVYLVEDFKENYDVLLNSEKRAVVRDKETKILAFSRGLTLDRILTVTPFRAYYKEKERYITVIGKTLDERLMIRDKAGSIQLVNPEVIDVTTNDYNDQTEEKFRELKTQYDQGLLTSKAYRDAYRKVIDL